MKAVRGSKKKPRSRNLTTSSSSSAKAEKSKPSKDVLELGKHLVEELGHADRGTTLGRWMSHHLAGLMHAAENEGTARKSFAARSKAEKLILQLWEQRAALPGGADPMARYKAALSLLDLLSPAAVPWQRHSAVKLHAHVATLHDNVSKLIYGVLLADMKRELPKAKFEALAVNFLSHTEQRLHQLLSGLSIQIVVHGDEEAAPQPPVPASTEHRIRASLKSISADAEKALAQISKELSNTSEVSTETGHREQADQ
jgi:hypothetical protein